jgi:hypothetical protein
MEPTRRYGNKAELVQFLAEWLQDKIGLASGHWHINLGRTTESSTELNRI